MQTAQRTGLRGNSDRLLIGSAALLLLAPLGCSNRQGGMNPFLTADRVPPPSTRALPPGAAQPYYQGDTLPVTPGTAPAPVGVYPPQGSYSAAPGPAFAAAPTLPANQPVAARSAVTPASFNEPAMVVPTDDSAARIAYTPPPAPMPASPPFVQAPVTAAGLPPQPAQPVVPANFAAPVSQASPTPAFSAAPQSSDGLPWNSGSAPRGNTGFVANPTPQPAAQLVPVAAPAPRVRLPGYPTPQQTFVTPGATGSTVGRVQITELPPHQPYVPSPATPTTASDGFRARGTTSSLPQL